MRAASSFFVLLQLLALMLAGGAAASSSAAASAPAMCSSESGAAGAGSDCSIGAGAAAAAVFDPYVPLAPLSAAEESEPRVQHMWTTPLFITRPRFRDVGAFNRALSQRAMDAFEALLQREGASGGADSALSAEGSSSLHPSQSGDAASGANERFFSWQALQHSLGQSAEGPYLTLARSKEFVALKYLFASYAKAFLEGVGKGDAWEQPMPGKKASSAEEGMFCWAAVSRDGNSHLSHTHPDSLLSGVYYSRIPSSGAGALVFDDPRGPRWPFDGRFIHRPQAGQLVMFPSWLVHQVTPTLSPKEQGPRVAWSCNLPGSWEETADINLV